MPPELLVPALIAAGGALFGVLMTVSTQVLTSGRQRRQERVNKLFDLKLELYSESLRILEEHIAAWAATTKLAVDLRQETDKLQELAAAGAEIKEILAKCTNEDGTVKADLDAETRARARESATRYQRLEKERKDQKRDDGGTVDEKGKQEIEKLLASRDELLKLAPRASLVADEKFQSEFVLVLEKVLVGVEMQPTHLTGLRRAARAELGVRDRRAVELFRAGRRKILLAIYQFRNRNKTSVFKVLHKETESEVDQPTAPTSGGREPSAPHTPSSTDS